MPPYLPLVCSNVLLDGSLGTAKICDLGQSGILQASIVTAHGTPNCYSSPEQLAGGWCGPASDIYSLGIVMLEVLTGRAARGRDARAELQLRCATRLLCCGVVQQGFAAAGDQICRVIMPGFCLQPCLTAVSCRVPEHCPVHVAELVGACLAQDASTRPSAEQVMAALQGSSVAGGAAGAAELLTTSFG